MSMSYNLPLEIVEQVLLRLPIKSLLRCSLVSKEWKDLITSPNFILAHLAFIKSLNDNTPLLIAHHYNPDISCIRRPCKRNHAYVLYSHNEEGTFEEYTRFEFSSKCLMGVVGLCNGLICLATTAPVAFRPEEYQEVVLWNPMIRRSLSLPEIKPMSVSFPQIRPHVFGFVFDHIGNDYKVLRIHEWKGVPCIVEVFRLSTGLWEDISNQAPFRLIFNSSNQADLKGIAHWIGMDNNGKSKIITFDMHEEVFGSIGLPINVVNDDEIYVQVTNQKYHLIFEESLFLIRRVNSVFPKCGWKYDIWKMEEYNVVESWTQVHSWIFDTLMVPLGFTRNAEILWVRDSIRLISTNLVDSTLNYVGIYPNGRCYSSYLESLVLLDKTLPTGAIHHKVEIFEDS